MALTLYQGDAHKTYVEHPIETARKALVAAARVETGRIADQLQRFADGLPERQPITKKGGGECDDWEPGERLLEDVFDLIRRRLPSLAADDPVRRQFALVLPSVARSLGNPRAALVSSDS